MRSCKLRARCRKGDTFQGPREGSCLTLGNELSEETHVLTKAKDFIGKGHLGGEQQGKGTQENCSVTWFAVSSFTVMGLVSDCLWPIILTQGPSWRRTHLSAKMDSRVRLSGRLAGHIISFLLLLAPPEFFWVSFTRHTMGWRVLPPLGPSRILPVSFGGSTLILTGTSCCETTHASGYRHV